MRESIIDEIIMLREFKKEEIDEQRKKLESLSDFQLLEKFLIEMRHSYYYEGYQDGYDDASDECDCG